MTNNQLSNNLIHETSPYLLQHAHNPVDWFAWGDEAFAKAKTEDKPVFLSIGYSACHWCHVMERESFEDEETASVLNKYFVCIKVDREERPDIDHIYMDACVGLTGQGGWPLSCFLTFDKKPFYAGTYYPKEDRYNIPGFKKVLSTIAELWVKDRQRLLKASDKVMQHIGRKSVQGKTELHHDMPHMAFSQLKNSFDSRYGGFGHAPKFPSVHNLLFLMRYGIFHQNEEAFDMVEKTLLCMAKGGIFDHIGGGFCRYSTDKRWLVPHFEKMMYDNAMLILAYCEAGAAIDKRFFKTASRTIEYCLREMQDSGGGFYTAQDADSEGVEGKYYVFSPDEVESILGEEDGKRFCGLFDITGDGNFEGKSIPNLIDTDMKDEDNIFADESFKKLYACRKNRIPPFKDDKVLTSVNGLMICALATAGKMMNNKETIAAAEKCMKFLQEKLFIKDRLYASYREGVTSHPATLEDYAYLGWGLLELYQATLETEWLEQLIRHTERMIELFSDETGGAFFISGTDVEDLPVRTKNIHDGALPSGNAVAANILMHLGEITESESYLKIAEGILNAVSEDIKSYPAGFTALLSAQLLKQDGMKKIAVVNGKGAYALLKAAQMYNPFAHVILCGEGYEAMLKLAPESSYYKARDSKAIAYLCDPHGCRPPFTDAQQIHKALKI